MFCLSEEMRDSAAVMRPYDVDHRYLSLRYEIDAAVTMFALTSRSHGTRVHLKELGAQGAQSILRGARRPPGSRPSGRPPWPPLSHSLPRGSHDRQFPGHSANRTK